METQTRTFKVNTAALLATDPKQFLNKILRIRKALIKASISKKDAVMMRLKMRWLEKHLTTYPNASKTALAKFTNRHRPAIEYIMPGTNCSSYDALYNQLQNICNYAITV